MSVPNQYCGEGHLSRRTGANACGSTVPSQGANTAIPVINNNNTVPTTIVGWRRTWRRMPLRRAGSALGRVSSLSMMAIDLRPLIPDAGVEQRVAQIDQEVDQHIGGREYQDDA